MKLILTTDVPGLGGPGDIVEVRDGYGRNFLLPQGKAIAATKGAEKQVATIKRAQLAREIRGTEHANEVKQALEKLGGKLKITARTTGDGTKLFGSITAIDVADAIKSAGGPALDRRTIDTGGHIKTVGAHPVSVKLHPGVTAAADRAGRRRLTQPAGQSRLSSTPAPASPGRGAGAVAFQRPAMRRHRRGGGTPRAADALSGRAAAIRVHPMRVACSVATAFARSLTECDPRCPPTFGVSARSDGVWPTLRMPTALGPGTGRWITGRSQRHHRGKSDTASATRGARHAARCPTNSCAQALSLGCCL